MSKQSRYVLKQGHSGELVEAIQDKLGLRVDGVFGPKTRDAIQSYQIMKGLKGDGIVGPMTWNKLGLNPQELEADTDITTGATWIEQHPLPDGEYVKEETAKKWIFIHHTAGRHNPYKVIDQWGRDQRGRIGTHYVIGGQPASGADETKYDGRILQAFKDEYWAYHLGKTKSGWMNRHSVGLEICAMGYLDNDLKTYVGSTCQPDQVIELKEPFRGYLNYHKYSDEQIKATEKWIRYVGERDGIDIRVGLQKYIKAYGPVKGFGFQMSACLGEVKGLLTHTNVRKDKSDCYPDPNLVDMILSL